MRANLLQCISCDKFTEFMCKCCNIPICDVQLCGNKCHTHEWNKILIRIYNRPCNNNTIMHAGVITSNRLSGSWSSRPRPRSRPRSRLRQSVVTNNLIIVPSDDDIQHDVEIPDDASENTPGCVICMINKPICVITPCMHCSTCISCSIQLTKGKNQGEVKCPTCNCGIKKIKRIYF